jgi:hypothetical protein
VCLSLFTIQANAQTKNAQTKNTETENIQVQLQDSVLTTMNNIEDQDSLFGGEKSLEKIHNPGKATMFSAIIPGLGQIYNKQSWKVPIIYGALIGLGIAIDWNQNQYLSYRQAYFDLNDDDATTTSYNETLGYEVDEFDPPSTLNTSVELYVTAYSRQRNQMIIYTVGFYLLNVLDANVNAHFIDFDISEDLSFNFKPIGINPITNTPVPGVTFAFNF